MSFPPDHQLAAALLQIPDEEGMAILRAAGWRRPIPHEHAKRMSAKQVISLYQKDHDPERKEHGGPDIFWNLTWRFIGPHRRKSAGERTEMARERDVRETQALHHARMAAKASGAPRPVRRGPPLRSRGFDRTKTRTFRGEVVPRKQRRRP